MKTRFHRLCVGAVLSSCALLHAQSDALNPSISNISGTITHGSILTVSGSGFGAKATAAPFLWENWESGTGGTKVDSSGNYAWKIYRNDEAGAGMPIYSSERPYSGKQSMSRQILKGNDFSTPYAHDMNTRSVYISFMVYWEVTAGAPQAVHKWWRITSGAANPYQGNPCLLASNVGGDWGFSLMDPAGAGDHTQMNAKTPPSSEWSRVELQFVLSSPAGANTGIARYWLNGENLFDLTDVVTSLNSTDNISSFLLPAELANADAFRYKVFVDDLYISTGSDSVARVEIGNASTFAACTHREIQIPNAWSDTSVGLSFNQGSFPDGAVAYLFVVDSNGGVSAGYPVTIGARADTTAPTRPTNLRHNSVTASTATLTWTASLDNVGVTGYRVIRNGSQVGTVAAPTTTYTDTGLSVGTTYSYTAVAFDAAGNVSPSSSAATVLVHDETYTAFADWVAGNFTAAEQANSAISGRDADPDGSGLTNLARYAFNLAARGRVANPVTVGTSTFGSASYLTLTFPRRAAADDLTYTLEASTDLVTWTAVPDHTYSAGAGPITAQDAVALGSAPRRFLRIRITQQ